MILIDTVEELYDLFDNLPDIILCFNSTKNETSRIEATDNDYTHIEEWFTEQKDYKVNDFRISMWSNSLVLDVEIETEY